MLIYKTASLSRTGGRSQNEDFLESIAIENSYCWVVADGLGGHEGGEIASQLAVNKIIESFQEVKLVSGMALKQYLHNAQDALVERQKREVKLASMRTTVVVLLAQEAKAVCGHVGDSRLYYLHSGKIAFQTKDHSVPQAMVNAGEISPGQVRYHEDRNRLLRVLGMEGEMRPVVEQIQHPISRGDAFLLCTDGFWEYVTEIEMEIDFAKSYNPEEWLTRMESRLLGRVKDGHDNYSVNAIFVK
jgi:PPM family protein phosphatase